MIGSERFKAAKAALGVKDSLNGRPFPGLVRQHHRLQQRVMTDSTYAPTISEAPILSPAKTGTKSLGTAAVLYGVDDLRLEEWSVDAPQEGEVCVSIRAVGICGSDVHYWKRGGIGKFKLQQPMVIGHECAGIITSLGPGDTRGLAVGDRVCLEPALPCWCSQISRNGRYNLDPDMKCLATPPHHGCLASSVNHSASLCYKLPEGVSLEEGAMCEPMSVGIHACRRGGVQPGVHVAIMGAGPIGLITMLVARAYGASSVTVVDVDPRRVEVARSLGASHALLWRGGVSVADIATEIRQVMPSGEGAGVVVDCAGFESTMQAGVQVCATGGKVVLVGMGADEMKLNLLDASMREVDIMGCFRYCNTFPIAVDLLHNGRIDVKPLITHRFGLTADDLQSGFRAMHNARESGAIKVMFNL